MNIFKARPLLLVIGSTAAAFALRLLFAPILKEGVPFIFFFVSVMISAWAGGFSGGIVATVFATLLSDYYFLPPYNAWTLSNSEGQILQLVVFMFCGALISYAGHLWKRQREQLRTYIRQLQVRTDENQKNYQSLRAITESLPSVVITAGSDMRVQLANKMYCTLFGCDDDHIIGKHVNEVFPSPFPNLYQESIEQGFRGRQQDFDMKVLDIHGMERTLHVNVVPVLDKNHEVERLLVVGSDITERVEFVEAVEKSEMEFRTIFELAGSGKFELELQQFKFLRVNRKFCSITGYDKDALLKMSFFDLFPLEHREEKIVKFREMTLTGEREWNLEWQFVRKNGNLFWASITGAILFQNGTPSRAISTVQDTTGRKEIEIELAIEKQRAEEASLAKSAFLANMSHEIRTPLGAMLGFTQLLLDSEEFSSEARNYLSIVHRNGDHLFRLVNELLDISKIEANKMEVENIEFDLEELLRDISILFAMKAREKGLEFQLSSSTDLPQKIISDPTRLRQILANLIGNAIKFTEKGAIDIQVKSTAQPEDAQREKLVIRVIDTGLGIPAEKQELLFHPFSQIETSTARKYGGTGLGLYLSRRMADALGGKLYYDGQANNKGSIFSLELTTETPTTSQRFSIKKEKETDTTARAYQKRKYARIDGVKILVVDDVDDNLHLARLYLTASGAKVDCALSAAEAFDLINSESYDLIFMDIQMPVMDGYEAIKILRDQGIKLPIFALTAHSMKGERERCLKAGFSGYLSKPIDRTLMLETIRQELGYTKSSLNQSPMTDHTL